jgi:flagellar basal-body rod protein FlgB
VSATVEPPLMSALKAKMRWHEARQGVIAENVANAATPGFRGADLKAFAIAAPAAAPARTDARHLGLDGTNGDPGKASSVASYGRTPDGNGVVLEEQMMKAAQNQMDHQMAASLYQKSLGLIRTALGRRG